LRRRFARQDVARARALPPSAEIGLKTVFQAHLRQRAPTMSSVAWTLVPPALTRLASRSTAPETPFG
jgi:hypothetical protein